MKLEQLLHGYPSAIFSGQKNINIKGIVTDSREVQPGFLFAALKGNVSDGNDFIAQAVNAGASCILTDPAHETKLQIDIPVISDLAPRKCLAHLCDRYFDSPWKNLKLTGVTGTNGKTTTTHMIHELLIASGESSGVIGTIGCRINNDPLETHATTPESPELYQLLDKMVTRNVHYACMEVSSHALIWNRVNSLQFDTAVFTNLTQDHLDFHGNMESYLQAKKRLFSLLKTDPAQFGLAVINADDAFGKEIAHGVPHKCPAISYGMTEGCDVFADEIRMTAFVNRFTIRSDWGHHEIELKTPGKHNIYNALAAFAVNCCLGINPDRVAESFVKVPPVPGRMERIDRKQPFLVIVDYAHTPDALYNLLGSLKPLTKSRLITVFGCGGDRDRSKRPLMARAVSELSDISIVTADNPRTESLQRIINDILPGMNPQVRYSVISNRREAIHQAIQMAKEEDIVVIAGKGHETYQTIGRKNYPFDDRLEVSKALEYRGYKGK